MSKEFNQNVFLPLKSGKAAIPPVNYLVIFLFACHGVLLEGTTHILLNEYDEKTGYYKLFPAEKKLRTYAETYPNAYILGIFACCRR